VAAFLDALLRGAGLSSQAVVAGGVLFAVLVLRPASRRMADPLPLVGRCLRLIAAGAAGVAIAQCLALLVQLEALADERGWPLGDVLPTTYFRASVVRLAACAGLALCGWILLRGRGGARGWVALIGLSLVLVASSAWMSHAAARLEHRAALLGLDTLHQFAAAVWVGGLVHLMAAAFRSGEPPWPVAMLRRFSAMALVAVTMLVAAGAGLSVYYIDGMHALLGTAYGTMVLTKGVILAGLLVLGAMNFLAIRRLPERADVSSARVRRFVEVEVGLGLTVLFAAASLTSAPPAVDVVADRATFAEVGSRFTPRWPTLTSPAIETLPVADRNAPRTAEDRAWSEYNHNVAGLFVLAMGLLATVQRMRWGRWARHWPLIFLGLAAFLFVRNDPAAWPLGPFGFWETMADPVVLQHRFFVLLVAAFGLFEWMVRTERLRARGYTQVFPLLCAVGGALLLAHSHTSDNLKEAFLIEVTHQPLGILGASVGWARWLELRLPAPDDRLPGRLWAFGLALVGLLLLFYRER
jgi:putative copper resistance protein D